MTPAVLVAVMAFIMSGAANAATLFSDDFEDGSLSPWSVIQGDGNDAGVNGDTSQSGSQSLYVRFDTVEVATPVIDTSGSQTNVSLWTRRGDGDFSNTPENGEDLELYYIDDGGNPVLLDTFAGGGPGGETFTPTYSLPADGRHAGFRFIARLTDSNGFDYWHIDDVSITQPDSPFIGSGTGLTGAYCNRANGNYDSPCTNNPDVTQIDPTVDFSNGDANWPPGGIGGDTFSVRWTGQIQAQYTEDYTFHALHDDGVRVWVNGTLVIDQYSDQDDAWTDSGTAISLQRGQRYDIVIEYYENGGQQDMTLAWSSASTAFRTTVPQTQLYPTSAPSANLLAAWRMDAIEWTGATGEVTDSSGNGRDGTALGGATTEGTSPAIAGDPGTCRYGAFDGNDDAVTVPNLSDTLNGTASLTFWIRTTQTGNDTGYQAPGVTGVEQAGGTDDIFWGWIDAAGRIGISVGNDYDNEQRSTTRINDGTWHHVALTRDASTGNTRVYVDGNLERTGTTGAGTIGTPFSSIGQIETSGGGGTALAGNLDEVRIYDGVLGESTVQTIQAATHPCPNAPSQGVLDYQMDAVTWNGTPDEVDDATANNLDGVSQGATTDDANRARPGNVGTCGYGVFDGSGYVEGPNSGLINTNDSVSASLWLRMAPGDQSGSFQTILAYGGSTIAPDGRFELYRYFGELYFEIRLGDGDIENVSVSGGSVFDDAWHHVVATYSYDNRRLQLYVDGQLAETTNFNGRRDLNDTNGPFSAGARPGGQNPIVGSLDEVRLFNTALTASVIDGAYQRTRACGPLIDHYAILDPGQGLTCEALPVTVEARDSSGNPIQPSSGTTIDVAAVIPGGTTPAPDTTWASSDSDQTSYTFGGGASSVTLQLQRTSPGSVNVNVDDGSATEIASADPDIPFVETGFLFYADGSPNVIGNQIAAKPSNVAPGSQSLTVHAVEDPNGPTPGAACEARFSDDQTIEMAFECSDPDACSGSRQVAVNGTDIPGNDDGSVSSYGNITLDFGTDGSAPLELLYPDAGEVRLHAREDLPASGDDPAVTLTGTSNRFVVRPFGFHVAAVGNPGATTATGGAYQAAGTDFTARVSAVGWSSGDDTDADGVPDGYGNNDPTDNADLSGNTVLPNFGPESSDESAALTSRLYRPSAGNDPALGGTPSIAESAFEDGSDGGLGSGETPLRYAEVGIIELRANLGDGDYLGTGVDIPGRSRAVGRFIPADFDQTATDGMFRNVCAAVHTYIGQEFSYQSGGVPTLTITARNGATPPAITQNYTGAFAKLVAGDIDRTGPTADGSRNGADGTPLEVVPSLSMGSLADNGDGTLTYTFAGDDTYRYERNLDRDGNGVNDARVAPFDSDLRITIDAIEDSDNVSAAAANREDVEPAATELRFGRLVIDNVAGAEVAPVEQVLRAEYFESDANGDRWLVNTDDGCTAFALAAPGHEIQLANDDDLDSPVPGEDPIDVAGGTTSIQEAGPVALTSGTAVLTFSAPGAANTGWVDTTALLTGGEHPYLAIDPEGNGSWTTNPDGRVTFGIYTGRDARILLREIPAN